MSEEDQPVDVVALPKFDMPSYELTMTAKDVKSLVVRHGIPLDLHPLVPLGLNRLTMFELYCRSLDIVPSVNLFRVFYKVRWKKRIFFLDRRAIPDAMAWKHHDSDVNDPALKDGFSALDVQALTERVIDLRPVPSGLLFQGGLATTWDFPGFCLVFKDTEGNGNAL
ncbi:hypothetical protein Tco_1571939 [Tanacetum coccineum]